MQLLAVEHHANDYWLPSLRKVEVTARVLSHLSDTWQM